MPQAQWSGKEVKAMIYASPNLKVIAELDGDGHFFAPTIFFPTLVMTIVITVGQTVIL